MKGFSLHKAYSFSGNQRLEKMNDQAYVNQRFAALWIVNCKNSFYHVPFFFGAAPTTATSRTKRSTLFEVIFQTKKQRLEEQASKICRSLRSS